MFFGREYYLGRLAELLAKPMASVVTCRGRRRVGKSTLFEEFARRNGCHFLKIEGLTPGKRIRDEDQRRAFGQQLSRQSRLPEVVPSSWPQAFQLADSAISDEGWTVLLLDEISWMGSRSRTFSADLKIAWDNLFRKHDRLILVLCGSVSSWLTENIVKSTGFLGRRSLDFVLPELPVSDAVKFWGEAAGRRSSREILDTLAVTGGVPRYLEEMNPALPVDENVRRTCFLPDGYLFADFENIFDRVFGRKARRKRQILGALADGPKTVSEVAAALGLERNGVLSADLAELDTAGFVAADRGLNPATGEQALRIRYRIKDCYSRFYLRYVLPERERIEKGLFDAAPLSTLPGWETLLGLQFETLVANNLKSLFPHLGLSGVNILSAAPWIRRGERGEGCQIDLLVQTESSAYVVEIKRRREIPASIVDEVQAKIDRLPLRRGLSVRTALVYDGELAPSVVRRGWFDFLVPATALLVP